MAKRVHTAIMTKIVQEAGKCELCGSSRNLEAHHIIPVTLGGTDEKENILCVCKKCHALLTPSGLLTKMKIAPLAAENRFYKHFSEITDAGERFTVSDVFDYLDENIFPIMRSLSVKSHTEEGQVIYKQIGQPKGAKLTTKKSIKCKEIIMQRSRDFNGDLSDVELLNLTGLARGTYYKYKRELKNNA